MLAQILATSSYGNGQVPPGPGTQLSSGVDSLLHRARHGGWRRHEPAFTHSPLPPTDMLQGLGKGTYRCGSPPESKWFESAVLASLPILPRPRSSLGQPSWSGSRSKAPPALVRFERVTDVCLMLVAASRRGRGDRKWEMEPRTSNRDTGNHYAKIAVPHHATYRIGQQYHKFRLGAS